MRRISLLLAIAATTTAGHAQRFDERALPREVAREVVQLHEATGTRRLDGPATIAASDRITQDVVVLGGTLTLAGAVTGKVIVVNGDVVVEPGGRIDGELLVVGGRVVNADAGTITGAIRTYSTRLGYSREGERIVWRDRADEDDRWWRRRDRWRDHGWGDLRLVSARTYNRVEGLPVQFGPAFGREFSWGRLSIDALGILRSTNSFEWTPPNVGHTAKAEVRLGHDRGIRLTARHVDVVEAVEPWQLGDAESGLAAFFLHRDYRDYFNRHGGSVGASLFRGRTLEVGGTFSDVRWASRATTDPWTLFRDTDTWRANPVMDDADLHLAQGRIRFDTRSDERQPSTGWLVTGEYEYGNGTIRNYAPTTAGVRLQSPGGATTYDRVFVDIRRYNRVAPGAHINLRLAAGGWLSGDELPLQRRFALGGPATLPGYDFRQVVLRDGVDRLTCSNPSGSVGPVPVGTPGECERMMLAQVEFRGDFDIDPFGILDDDRNWRRRGWGRGAQWVVFADAGRGWLVGPEDGGRSYPKSVLPRLSTFQTDVGLGLVLDDLGLYIAKPLGSDAPVNFFIRLRPRF